MAISMHSASVPTFERMLGNLLVWLDKAEAYAKVRKFDPDNYLGLRLAPDMLPFAKQIQIASDTSRGCVCRLAGVDIPKWDDNETTIGDLRQRVQRTIEFVKSVAADQIDGSEERDISIPMRNRDPIHMKGEAYLNHWALPNFYFHVTTAYALLRHAGVEIGKGDYLDAAEAARMAR